MAEKSDKRKILRAISKTSKKIIEDRGYLPFHQPEDTTRDHYVPNAIKARYS